MTNAAPTTARRRPSIACSTGSSRGAIDREVDEVLRERAPRVEDVQKLPQMGMILRETLRLYPPGWIFTREATEDDVIRGYVIPKGAERSGDIMPACVLVGFLG